MKIEDIRNSGFFVPIFSVTDIASSFEFYTQVMMFEKRWEWGEPVDYGCVGFGDKAELFLCQDGQGQSGSWAYLFIDGVTEYAEIIRANGADILSGPTDEPWGMREMHVKDPDGHLLRIGTSLERLNEQ